MAGNRKKAQAYILEMIQRLTPKSTANRDLYAKRFETMSDKQFEDFIDRLDTEQEVLMVVTPNHIDDGLDHENNLRVAESIGHDFFTRIMVSGKSGLPDHLTPIKYMVMDLPVRRFSQTSVKKIKVPKNTDVIDSLTGQVTGDSKGASLTGPEVQILAAMGLEAPLLEAMKLRGGDRQARVMYQGLLSTKGSATLAAIAKFASGVESTRTLRTLLLSCHLKNTL